MLVLWVPLTQVLAARNSNRASAGCALTASSVVNSAAVSTPLLGWVVVDMIFLSVMRR